MENPAFDVAALLAPPDILKSKCALCIQPHPDDNEIGMGGVGAGGLHGALPHRHQRRPRE